MRWLVPLSTLASLRLLKWADVLQLRIKPPLSIPHALQHKLLTPATTEAIAVLGKSRWAETLCVKGKATSSAEKEEYHPLLAVQMLLKFPTCFCQMYIFVCIFTSFFNPPTTVHFWKVHCEHARAEKDSNIHDCILHHSKAMHIP